VANKKFVVELSAEERERLSDLISKGKSPAKVIVKARILLKADRSEAGEGWPDEKICDALDTNITMVARVRAKLVQEGLDAVLARKKRRTPPIEPIPAFAGTSLRWRRPSAADRVGLHRAASRLRPLDDPPFGRESRGDGDRRGCTFQ